MVLIFLVVPRSSVWGTPRQEINPVLNIFRPCYTDSIVSKSVFDIPEPNYPILISTPQDHNIQIETIIRTMSKQ